MIDSNGNWCSPTSYDRLLLAYSGSVAGAVVVDMMHEVSNHMRMECHVAFVDTSVLFDTLSDAARAQIHTDITTNTAKYNFPLTILRLEDIFAGTAPFVVA